MATSRSGGGRRKAPSTSSSSGFEPVFSGDSNIIPGEVLVTLSSGAAAAMTASVPLHPAGSAGSRADLLGVEDIDSVLADLGAHDITRLAPVSGGMADGLGIADTSGLLQADDNPLSRSFRVRINPDQDVAAAATRLQAVDVVTHAEPNRWREASIVPNDPEFANQWGLTRINAPTAWDTTTGSSSVVVAVIDSGCDLDHPELAPLLVPGFDMVDLGPNPIPELGWRFEGDFAGRDDTPEDEVGHGTHVAGTIACLSNNAASVAGVGWQTRVMPIKALTRMVRIVDNRVTGVGSAADIAAAIRWAVDHGAHVINMSLGSDGSTVVEESAVAYAVSNGVVVVAAMGNDGSANPSYPAAYPDVVAVGAIDSADQRASFSQTGPHIDVAAPGVGILSTYLAGGTTTMRGTSMAAPHVAGVAALIKAVKPTATGAEIADILRTTARALRDNPGDPVPNDQYGFGCVDAAAAVAKAAGPAPVLTPTVVTTPFPTTIPTIPIRTPLVFCPPPFTTFVRDCLPLSPQVFGCGQPITIFQKQCLPVTPTPKTPTITPTTPFRGQPFNQAAQGYDPYGLLGQAAPAAAPSGGTYEEGYAAGYAAAMAQAAQPAAGAPPAEQADVRFPFPGGFRSVFQVCLPDTVTAPPCTLAPITIPGRGCPLPTRPINCPPPTLPWTGCPVNVPTWPPFPTTTPIRGPIGQDYYDPYGQGAYGYDPYGQNPFEG